MRHRLPILTQVSALIACGALAACVPAPPAPPATPTPAPAPGPRPAPAPSPTPPPFAGNWIDAPQTPGDWFYDAGAARFGPPQSEALLVLRCDRPNGVVEVVRAGTAPGATQMSIRTETMDRGVAVTPSPGPLPTIVARIPARDPLLDAMAFSRGRFAVEITGLPTLYVPAYPEVTRAIEDCR